MCGTNNLSRKHSIKKVGSYWVKINYVPRLKITRLIDWLDNRLDFLIQRINLKLFGAFLGMVAERMTSFKLFSNFIKIIKKNQIYVRSKQLFTKIRKPTQKTPTLPTREKMSCPRRNNPKMTVATPITCKIMFLKIINYYQTDAQNVFVSALNKTIKIMWKLLLS